jgi:hypothetical protein
MLNNTDLEDSGLRHAVCGEDFQFNNPLGLRCFKTVDAFPQVVNLTSLFEKFRLLFINNLKKFCLLHSK